MEFKGLGLWFWVLGLFKGHLANKNAGHLANLDVPSDSKKLLLSDPEKCWLSDPFAGSPALDPKQTQEPTRKSLYQEAYIYTVGSKGGVWGSCANGGGCALQSMSTTKKEASRHHHLL